MSLLLLSADPGTAEPWVFGAVVLPRSWIVLILELRNELWNQGILTENFLNPSSCQLSVSNCWTLDCWAVVLSTRPRRSCWENNFGTSSWSIRLRNLNRIMRSSYLNRKYSKSKSLNLNCAAKVWESSFLTTRPLPKNAPCYLPDVAAAACGSWNPLDSNCWSWSCWAIVSLRK